MVALKRALEFPHENHVDSITPLGFSQHDRSYALFEESAGQLYMLFRSMQSMPQACFKLGWGEPVHRSGLFNFMTPG